MTLARNALGAAVADAAAAAAGDEAEQLSLLPTRTKPDDGERERVVSAVRRDRAGRPAGATNIANRDMLDFVRKKLGDPVLSRARWAMHTPESLSIELGCTKLEAFDRLDRMWSELSRLFYAPLAAVDGQGNVVPPFFQMVMGGGQAAGPGARPPWEYIKPVAGEVIENTPQSDAPDPVSHGAVSHETPK